MRIAGEEASLQARNLVVELVLCYCTLFEVVPSTTGALADNACHFSACFSTSSIFEHLSHAPCIGVAAAMEASLGRRPSWPSPAAANVRPRGDVAT